MYGLPKEFNSQADILNSIDYVNKKPQHKTELIRRLLDLKNTTTMLVLKNSSKDKDPEEQTQDDFEKVSDPNAKLFRLGFTVDKINQLLGGLGYVA